MTLEETTGQLTHESRSRVDSFLRPAVMAPLVVIGAASGAMLGTAGFEIDSEPLQYAGAVALCATTLYAVVGTTHYIYNMLTRGGRN